MTSRKAKDAIDLLSEPVTETRKIRIPLPRDAPRADPAEVIKLVRKAKKGDLYARDEIVRANMGFIYGKARRIARVTGHDPDELVQESVFGMYKAIDKYDETYGVKFLSYAGWWIMQTMMRTTERLDAAGFSGTMHLVIRYGRALREHDRLIVSGLAPAQALSRMARKVKLSTTKLALYFSILRSLSPASFDAEHAHADGAYTMHDLIVDERQSHIDHDLDSKLEQERVQRAVALLRPKLSRLEQMTLDFRLLPIDGRGERTLEEIGAAVNRTRERIRQVEKVVMRKLKQILVAEDLRRERKRAKLTQQGKGKK